MITQKWKQKTNKQEGWKNPYASFGDYNYFLLNLRYLLSSLDEKGCQQIHY